MANHTGVDGVVTIGGNTIAELKTFSIEESANTIEDSNLNSTASSFKAGKTSWTASIECHWDETDTTGQGAMTAGAEVTVIFLPEGNTSGDTKYTGTAIITGVSKAIAEEAIISQSFSLQGTGTLTAGTVV
ncbi:MAG: hypothetical protein QNJ78_06400 [Gammaproteobacteria bacterium]|nr:hypothetical protein [Gammaproteobacteria bacterium]